MPLAQTMHVLAYFLSTPPISVKTAAFQKAQVLTLSLPLSMFTFTSPAEYCLLFRWHTMLSQPGTSPQSLLSRRIGARELKMVVFEISFD
jgi:hypothetical protein